MEFDFDHIPHGFTPERFLRIARRRSLRPANFARLYQGPGDLQLFGRGQDHCCLIRRGGPVLMVAHVDTVCAPARVATIQDGRLYHSAVDNRLGVYLGLELLPALGVNVDLLLTTNEELGESTAQLFSTPHQYNWLFSFDRKGDDVVCYQYLDAGFRSILEAGGFRVGEGSYSCIAELGHLGCRGANFGNGMANYHSEGAYCDLAQLSGQLERFRRFYESHAHTRFAYPQSTPLDLGHAVEAAPPLTRTTA